MLDNFSTGYNHFINEDYNSAIGYFLKIPDYQNNCQILYYLAYSYFQMGNFSKSKEYSQVCFYNKPLDTINTKILILSCIYLSEKEEAKKYTNIYMQKADIPDDDIVNLYEKLNGKNYYESLNYPKLNILFIQESVGIRCYKFAKALISKGHKITLGYVSKKGSEVYKDLDDSIFEKCIKINDIQKIGDLCKNFDIVQCHNEPDYLTLQALTGNRPVIHDTADLISLRDIKNANTSFFEGLANKLAHGRMYSTVYQQAKAESLYELKTPALVFGNYISESDRPKEFLPKLSSVDNLIHIVYQGSISLYKHRNFIDIFVTLVKQGLVVHIYPVTYNKELADFFNEIPNIYYHEPVTPGKLLTELTKYDIGIIPWNLELGQKSFLDTTIANKLYEYLAAGLPVLTSDVKTYRDYFSINKVGAVYSTFEEIPDKVKYLCKLCENKDITQYSKSYEAEIHRLENFYFKLLRSYLNNVNLAATVRDRYLIKKYDDNKKSITWIKTKNLNSNKVDNLTGTILIIIPYIENMGGAAITIKLIVEEFVKRGANIIILTNKILESDIIELKKENINIIISDKYDLNVIPNSESLEKFKDEFMQLMKNYSVFLVITFPVASSIYLEYCRGIMEFNLVHYVTYEPNFSGGDKDLKCSFLINNIKRIMFISKAGAHSVFNFLDLTKGDNYLINEIGVPIPDIRFLLENKKSFLQDGYLKIIIVSRLAPTKSYILSLVEDIGKLINQGYKIQATIIGEGPLLPILLEIINTYSINQYITLNKPVYPLDYTSLQTFDLAFCMGTTAIITAALGIPTIFAIPTTWFNYYGYFAGYAGSLGILGVDYDLFNDSFSATEQKYTYFDIIKNIYNRTNTTEYLNELSEASQKYVLDNIKLLDVEIVVDNILKIGLA